MRLNKYLASCGLGSRRACEQLILEKRVSINGKFVLELATIVDENSDTVAVDNKTVRPTDIKTYVLLNKPKGYVTTVKDTHDRPTVLDLIKLNKRLFPVGRLDIDTEGLLLLTDDGDLAHRLLHPKYKVKKNYFVTLNKAITSDEIKKLEQGVALNDGITAPCKILINNSRNLEITLYEGRKRQIKRMFQTFNYKVVRLRRINFGPLDLSDIEVGKWRYLKKDEIEALLKFVNS